ncbi:hypothetical protein [Streptomyces vinaceus]|uniref:hypothetical protein n=1 Tax=Streptomyces vinaceus TaxID=1960 RepID=UPI0035DCB82C
MQDILHTKLDEVVQVAREVQALESGTIAVAEEAVQYIGGFWWFFGVWPQV